MKRHPLYKTWQNIKQRCTNKNNDCYYRYGGRGITMCKEWSDSFTNFLSDMGEKPSKDYSLDRIDNNKGYFKENCRWATADEQRVNKNPYGKAKFYGVCVAKNKHSTTYYAQVIHKNKKIYIAGGFETPEEAAKAYDKFILKLRGEKARLNFPSDYRASGGGK